MEGMKLIDETVGNTFLHLLGSPLDGERLMRLPAAERALYVVCRVKLGYWDDQGHHHWLTEQGTIPDNVIGGASQPRLYYLLFPVLGQRVSSDDILTIMHELVKEGLWSYSQPETFSVSPQVIDVLVALLIFREGGYVEFENVRHRNHLSAQVS